jgi:2-phosphoglycerate kinase
MRIILIVGAPGSGKSTIARRLAEELGIYQLIGTDTIREILRQVIKKTDCPTLHTSAILACENAPPNEDKMVWGFIKQAEDVKPGIKAVLERSIKENKDVIIEGIHPIPGLISDNDFKQIVIKISSEKQHLKQLDAQGTHRSHYKIGNFKKARAFQDFLISEAKKFKATVIENESVENSVKSIIESL